MAGGGGSRGRRRREAVEGGGGGGSRGRRRRREDKVFTYCFDSLGVRELTCVTGVLILRWVQTPESCTVISCG